MDTLTSWSTHDGDDSDSGGTWSLIREGTCDAAFSSHSASINWYVKGPSGLYGPFLEDEATARTFLQKKLDSAGNAASLSADMRPVEPIGPFAADNATFKSAEGLAATPGN